jgi:hypothetical protein
MPDRRKVSKAPPDKQTRARPSTTRKVATSSDTSAEEGNFRDLLRHTGTPGVFVNKMGVLVDERGVALTLGQLRRADNERFEAVLGEKIDGPVKFMKAVTLDPRTPLPLRLDAAKAVAPYTDRKMPTAIEGPTPGSPVEVNILSNLNTSVLSPKERDVLIALYRKMAEAAPDDTSS